MSVLIKGMEMPRDCPFCPMSHWNKMDKLTGCDAVSGKRYIPEGDYLYWNSEGRPDWCPLVEIPPHGRLIDADALDKKLINGGCIWPEEYAEWADECFANAPTVIEAEGREHDNNGTD